MRQTENRRPRMLAVGRPLMDAALFGGVSVAGVTFALARRWLSRQPPRPRRVPHQVLFGDDGTVDEATGAPTRGVGAMVPPRAAVDDLFWLRDDDRTNPDVLKHLRMENEYSSVMTSHLEALRCVGNRDCAARSC